MAWWGSPGRWEKVCTLAWAPGPSDARGVAALGGPCRRSRRRRLPPSRALGYVDASSSRGARTQTKPSVRFFSAASSHAAYGPNPDLCACAHPKPHAPPSGHVLFDPTAFWMRRTDRSNRRHSPNPASTQADEEQQEGRGGPAAPAAPTPTPRVRSRSIEQPVGGASPRRGRPTHAVKRSIDRSRRLIDQRLSHGAHWRGLPAGSRPSEAHARRRG